MAVPTDPMIESFRVLLETRQERFTSDAVFRGSKNLLEKKLLDRLASEHDAAAAESLMEMFAALAYFVPQRDYDLVAQCQRRAGSDEGVQEVLDLIEAGDHQAIQKALDARKDPELTRYYAMFRRVVMETAARRQQALSVQSLSLES